MESFSHRRENRKRGGERRRLPWLILGVFVVLCTGLLPLYLWWPQLSRSGRSVMESLLNHSDFSVREIKVRAKEKVGGSEIVAMAGLSDGMMIWKIDPVMIEKKVAQHPWVKRVVVRREFPHRVVIEVEERAAKAIVVLERLYYVDGDGFVFKEVGKAEPVDLPLLTGLKREDLLSQPQFIREKIQEALRLGDLAKGASLALSEIHLLAEDGVVLYPMNYPVALYMGWGDWEKKLERLQRVLDLWQGRESRLAALNLNFSDQVVAKVRTVNSTAGQLRSHG